MPLYRDFSDERATILVWKYDVNDNLAPEYILTKEERKKVEEYHPIKRLEFLMVRKLLKTVLPDAQIDYDGRQPFVVGKNIEISITHSFPYAAIGLSPKKIGIDMERFRPKILLIKDKFVYENEPYFIPADKEEVFYTIIWSVKESMYKLHHSKYWSLKKNYEVKPFELKHLSNIHCRVYDSEFSDEMKARVEFFDDLCFTIVEM